MKINPDSILRHLQPYVAVIDASKGVIYRNRKSKEEDVLTQPAVADAIEDSLKEGCGFLPVEVSLVVEGSDGVKRDTVYTASGSYAGNGMMVVTVMPVWQKRQPVGQMLKAAVENKETPKPAPAKPSADSAAQTAVLKQIANLSHDIRTPVNAITGFSKLILGTDDHRKQQQYVEHIETNSRLLLQLIDDVIDLAKMKEGEFKVKIRETDINELINSVKNTVEFRVPVNVVLNCMYGASSCRIMTDPDRLSQVLLNLVTNACKFTERGSITLGYEVRPDNIYFFVKDTGRGLDKESLKLLFQRYWRQNEKAPGNGLGLSICSEIIERLHGEIGAESEGTGKGSTFWFTIPATPVEENEQQDPERGKPAVEEVRKAEDTVEEAVASARRQNLPVLLVAEDNDSNYFLISSMLGDMYKLVHAWNGKEAVEMFPEVKPDLILMDINMPYMDGYEATKRIRQVSEDVPIIAVTAYAFSSDRTRIMENGFNSYVSKPVNAERLMAEIRRLLPESARR